MSEINTQETPDTTKLPVEVRAQMLSKETSIFFNLAKFEHAQRIANMLYQAEMWPKHLKTLGDALITLNLSNRLNTDPVLLAQTIYIVHGRPGLEGKLVKSLIDQSGLYAKPIRFKWVNEKDEEIKKADVVNNHTKDHRGCIAYTFTHEGEHLEGPKVSWHIVYEEGWYNKQGSKWKTMPELMFMYRSVSWFANVNCPEVKLGMHTREELQEITDLTPNANGVYGTSPTATSDLTAALKNKSGGLGPGELTKKAPETSEPSTSAESPTGPHKPHPWDRLHWFKMRKGDRTKTGYAVFVLKNLDTFKSAPDDIKKDARNKWNNFYPGDQFPPDAQSQDENQETGNDDDLISEKYHCPECKQDFDSIEELKNHNWKLHGNETPVEKFDRLCREMILNHPDYSDKLLDHFLMKFITAKAEINEIDTEAVKMEGAEDFVSFWSEFDLWLSKQDLTGFSPTGHEKPQETHKSDSEGENNKEPMSQEDMIMEIRKFPPDVRNRAFFNIGMSNNPVLSIMSIEMVKEALDECKKLKAEMF